MRRDSFDVVIVGGGLAGLGAAHELSGCRLSVLLVDENPFPGGQLLRERPAAGGMAGARALIDGLTQDPVKKVGNRMVEAVRQSRVTVMSRSRVLGVWPGREVMIEDDRRRIFTLAPRYLVLATGARERFVPFEGWTLPGVVSMGAAQILMKSAGVLPGRRTVVAGAGPLLFTLGGAIVRGGGEVAAVVDRSGPAILPGAGRGAQPQGVRISGRR